MGAWIEILLTVDEYREYRVAPRVGAWIEIRSKTAVTFACSVAPRVGAWIEMMCCDNDSMKSATSLPVWERGLKLLTLQRM